MVRTIESNPTSTRIDALKTVLTICGFLCQKYRPKTVFKVVSDMWNSPRNSVASASDCYFDFQNATICSYEKEEELIPATPQKIEDIFVSMRSDLLCIITRWEQSGQEEGRMDAEEEDNEGSSLYSSETSMAGVDNNSCENIGCLSVTLAPSSSSQRRRQWDQQHGDFPPEDLEASLRPLSHSILELAICQQQLGLDQAEKCQHEQLLVQQREGATRT
jgi:hypothetical protein